MPAEIDDRRPEVAGYYPLADLVALTGLAEIERAAAAERLALRSSTIARNGSSPLSAPRICAWITENSARSHFARLVRASTLLRSWAGHRGPSDWIHPPHASDGDGPGAYGVRSVIRRGRSKYTRSPGRADTAPWTLG